MGDSLAGAGRGFHLGWALLQLAWRHPMLGPRYRRIVLTQASVVLGAAAGLLMLGLVRGWEFRGEDGFRLGLPFLAWLLGAVAASYSLLLVLHWLVVALSFQFHDLLTREVSLLAQLVPEDPPLQPRIRLDFRWILKRLKRRARGFRVMLPGFVILGPLALLAPTGTFTVLSSLWAAFWWVVFSFAKSARAWPEPVPRLPWFLRGWDLLACRAPLLGRWPFSWWRRFAERSTSSVWAPVAWSERLPGEGMALGTMRVLAALPVVGMGLRPLVPVCAALLIERGELALDDVRRVLASAPPPVGAMEPRARLRS